MARTSTWFAGLWCVATAFLTATSAAEPGKDAANTFRVNLVSKVEMTAEGKKQEIAADTTFEYAWKRVKEERELTVDSVKLVAKVGDGEVKMEMSREKMAQTRDGKTMETRFDDAPEALKAVLRDSFGTPLCKIQVDKNGAEVKRTIVAKDGAKDLIGNGMIANTMIFHPPFHGDKNEWETETEVSMGTGGLAKGKLLYKKPADFKDGGPVSVSGTLTKDMFTPPGSPFDLKDCRYEVKGNQSFDPKIGEWTSGKLEISVSFKMIQGDKEVGNAKGKLTLTLERVAVKDK